MEAEEEFEALKKNYILKTLSHLNALEELNLDECRDAFMRSEIAFRQLESSTSFMALCTFIMTS